jgi:ABC-type multidrug transport system fused ATPase/permease subunit
LTYQPLCPEPETFSSIQTEDLFSDLLGNVTAALFSSMDITPSKKVDNNLLDNQQLLQMYMKLLAFVYMYFFVIASISMILFAAFLILSRRHNLRLHLALSTAVRILLAISLASLVSFASYFPLAYSFMTSPIILYAFTLALLTGQSLPRALAYRFSLAVVLLVDRLLDYLAFRSDAAGRQKRESGDVKRLGRGIVAMGPPPVERPDLRVSLSTVGEEDEVTGEVGSVGTAERRGNSAFMTGAGLSRSTVVT